jgi:photosystem II stability/assembly factor-like uncharacterized protein
MKRITLLIFTLLGFIHMVSAQWLQTNGPHGGNINCFTRSGNTLFAGSSSAIYISGDNGISWVQSNAGINYPDVRSFVTDETRVFAGTYNGVFLSADGGQHWTLSGLQYLSVNAMVNTGSCLIAGTGRGMNYSEDGIYVSSDHGVTWVQANNGIPENATVYSLVVKGPDVFAGTQSGIYRSADNGNNWVHSSIGCPNYIRSLATDGTDIYAGESGLGYGVFKSSDNGLNWMAVNNGLPFDGSSNEYPAVLSLACVGSTIYLGASVGLFASDDHAASWTAVDLGVTSGTGGVRIQSVASIEANLFAGTGDQYNTNGIGILLSSDEGQHWSSVGVNNTDVTALASCGPAVFAGTDHAGALYTTLNGGYAWDFTNDSIGDTYVTKMAVNGSVAFAGTFSSGIFVSENYGQTWTRRNQGLSNLYITALAAGDNMVYAGTMNGRVFSTGNNGVSWTELVGDLPGVESLAAGGGYIYAGTYDGVYGSSDNGLNWTHMDANIGGKRILSLIITGETVLAGTEIGGVYISYDHGGYWTHASGVFSSSGVYAFAMRGSSVFAGTDPDGVYQSTDNGAQWSRINTGLTFTNVRALTVDETNIYAGTHGKGVWARSLDEVVSAGNNGFDHIDVKVYPNPAKDKLNIELENFENTDIEIMGMDGRFIRRISLRSPETLIDLTNMASGIYALGIKNKQGYTVRRFIKQ